MIDLLTENDVKEFLKEEHRKRLRVGWELLYRDDFNLIIVKNRYYDSKRYREIWHYHFRVPEPPETEDVQVVNLYKKYLLKRKHEGITFDKCKEKSKSDEDFATSGQAVKEIEGSWYDPEQFEGLMDSTESCRFPIVNN